MRACSRCSGFVPSHRSTCPHCDAGPSRWSRLGRALIGLVGAGAAAMTLAACYGAPPYDDTCIDEDGDGWLPGCYSDDLSCAAEDANCDCNDHAADIHPGALDPAGDGVDRDCDGKDSQRPGWPLVDAGVTTDATWPEGEDWLDAGAEPDATAPPQ